MKTSRVILGILAGAAVGAIVGILFAPDKGTNTRKKFAKKGEDFAEDLKEKASHIKDQALEVADKFADAIHSSKSETKTKAGNNRVKVTGEE